MLNKIKEKEECTVKKENEKKMKRKWSTIWKKNSVRL